MDLSQLATHEEELIAAFLFALLIGGLATAGVLTLIDLSDWEKATKRRVILNDPRMEAKIKGTGLSLARTIMRVFFGVPKDATAWLEKGDKE